MSVSISATHKVASAFNRKVVQMRKTVSMQNLVKVSKSILSRCVVRKSYYLADENMSKIKEFMLFPSGLRLIKSVFEGFKNNSQKRVQLMWGTYGTGKSHLALILANLMGKDHEEKGTRKITSKIRDLDMSTYKLIKETRALTGKILVTFPETLAGGESRFRSPLLMSLNGALYQESLDYLPKTEGSLVEVVSDTIEFLRNNTACRGMVIIFDDFDRFLSLFEENPSHHEIQVFQEFRDFCHKSQFPVFFLGICSKSPAVYFKDDVTKAASLFDNIHYLNLFSKDATLEEFIGTRILEHPETEDRDDLYKHEDYDLLEKTLIEMNLYKRLSPRELRENVLMKTYPLHPVTLYCLPRISERLSTPEKNISTFFNDASPGGLKYFIENIATVQPSGRLSLYTPDYLYSYFEKNFKDSPLFSPYVESMEKSYIRVSEISNSRRILRLITTLQIIQSVELPLSEKNIIAAIHMGDKETKQLQDSLKKMVEKETLVHDEKRDTYEIPVEKAKVLFEEKLGQTKDMLRDSINPIAYLNEQYRPHRIWAKHYHQRNFSTRCAYGKYVSPSELKVSTPFIEEANLLYKRDKKYYKGDMLVLFCPLKSSDELPVVQEAMEGEISSHPNIMVAISKKFVDFAEEVLELQSLDILSTQEPAMNEPGSEVEKNYKDRMNAQQKSLKSKLKTFMKSDNLVWYYQGNTVDDFETTGDVSALSGIFRKLFTKSPLIRYRTLMTMALKQDVQKYVDEAVQIILANKAPIPVSDEPDSESEKIIKACLVDREVMELVNEEASIKWYDVSDNVPESSAFFEMWKKLIETFRPQGAERRQLQIVDLLLEFIKPPYGLGPAVVQVLLASFFRKFSYGIDFFSNYRLMVSTGDPDSLTLHHLNSDIIREMVSDPEDWVMFTYMCSEPERDFLTGIIKVFNEKAILPDSLDLWEASKKAVIEWYSMLPRMTRERNDFPEEYMGTLIEAIKDVNLTSDTRLFLKVHLIRALGFDPDEFSWRYDVDGMMERLKSSREELSRDLDRISAAIYKELSLVFSCKPEVDALGRTIREWMSKVSILVQNQENLDDDERAFLECLSGEKTLEEAALLELPGLVGLGPVSEWECDNSLEYSAWVKRVKLSLENSMMKDFLNIPSRYDLQSEQFERFVDTAMENLGIAGEEKLSILEGALEVLSWHRRC